jgi:threonine synthase
MGLPVNKLICASNENNVLTDFFKTGIYDKRRNLYPSTSPSMDILISSNLERLLFHVSGKNDSLIKDIMEELSHNGFYHTNKDELNEFYGDYSTEEEVAQAINDIFKSYNYLMDTHTAVAYSVANKYRDKCFDDTKTLVVSTASPYKFAGTVALALGINIENKDEFEIIEVLSKESKTNIPKNILELKDKPIVHHNNCDKSDMRKMIETFLKAGEHHD